MVPARGAESAQRRCATHHLKETLIHRDCWKFIDFPLNTVKLWSVVSFKWIVFWQQFIIVGKMKRAQQLLASSKHQCHIACLLSFMLGWTQCCGLQHFDSKILGWTMPQMASFEPWSQWGSGITGLRKGHWNVDARTILAAEATPCESKTCLPSSDPCHDANTFEHLMIKGLTQLCDQLLFDYGSKVVSHSLVWFGCHIICDQLGSHAAHRDSRLWWRWCHWVFGADCWKHGFSFHRHRSSKAILAAHPLRLQRPACKASELRTRSWCFHNAAGQGSFVPINVISGSEGPNYSSIMAIDNVIHTCTYIVDF